VVWPRSEEWRQRRSGEGNVIVRTEHGPDGLEPEVYARSTLRRRYQQQKALSSYRSCVASRSAASLYGCLEVRGHPTASVRLRPNESFYIRKLTKNSLDIREYFTYLPIGILLRSLLIGQTRWAGAPDRICNNRLADRVPMRNVERLRRGELPLGGGVYSLRGFKRRITTFHTFHYLFQKS
jgi:hypothetical protein